FRLNPVFEEQILPEKTAKEERMNRLSYCIVTLAVIVLCAPHAIAGSVSVDKNNVTNSYDCDGESASINGNRNTLTLNNCSEVSVAGNYNQITLTGNSSALAVP